MYCKYCGSPLESTDTQCKNCGSKIDFLDGGQSFFEDNDLNDWSISGQYTPLPKTEDIDFSNARDPRSFPIPLGVLNNSSVSSLEGEGNVSRLRRSADGSIEKRNSRRAGKRNKRFFSERNRFIALCILSVLIFVMIVLSAWRIIDAWRDMDTVPAPASTEDSVNSQGAEYDPEDAETGENGQNGSGISDGNDPGSDEPDEKNDNAEENTENHERMGLGTENENSSYDDEKRDSDTFDENKDEKEK